MKRRFFGITRPLAIAAAAFVVMSCDSGSFVDPEGGNTIGLPASLEIGGMPDTVVEQDTIALSAVVLDEAGDAIAVEGLEWSSSDDGVAGIESTGSGQASMTTNKPGTTTITVTYETLSASRNVRVHNRPVDLVLRSGNNQVGGPDEVLAEPLVVFAVDRRGDPVAGVKIEFSVVKGTGTLSVESTETDAKGLASTEWTLGPDLDKQGVNAEALKNQPLVKTMKNSVVEFMAQRELDIAALDVTPETATVEEGDSIQLDVQASTGDGGTIGDPGVTWESSDTTVAVVTNNGILKGRKGGKAFAIAEMQSTSGTVSDSAEVTVTSSSASPPPPTLARVVVSPDAATLDEGATTQLSATAYDTNDAEMSGVTFDWTSSNGEVAGVDQNGRVTAKVAGTALIIAAAAGIADTASVTVNAVSSSPPPTTAGSGIWISQEEIAALPTSGTSWDGVLGAASRSFGSADISNQDSHHDNYTLAAALACARTGDFCAKAEQGLLDAIGTEGGRWLAVSRNLAAYVIAADILRSAVGINATIDEWIRGWPTRRIPDNVSGDLRTFSPFHSGSNAAAQEGFAAAAVAAYLGDTAMLDWVWDSFRTFVCDPGASDPENIDLGQAIENNWVHDSQNPCAVNPQGTTKTVPSGLPGAGTTRRLDGSIGNDMRRGGPFQWEPGYTQYPWTGLAGVVPAALILERAGYPAFEAADRAVLRTHEYLWFLRTETGDEAWFDGRRGSEVVQLVNFYYGTSYPADHPVADGHTISYTDWTHSR